MNQTMTVEPPEQPVERCAEGEDQSRIVLAPGVTAARSAIRFSFARSSGPGGQNVNKVNTKAELRLDLRELTGLDAAAMERLRTLAGSRLTKDDELIITADDSRSQRANRETCMERLRELIRRAAVRPKPRKKKRLSRAQKEKRLQGKRERSEKKSRRQWRPGD